MSNVGSATRVTGEAYMKWFLAVGGLLLVSAVPAQAQFGASIGKVTFPNLVNYPAAVLNSVVVSGTVQDFVPTTYVSYDKGVADGQAALAAKPKSLGEVAQEYSHQTRAKAKLAFVQNAYGYAVIEQP
jgi:hypothetical protein